MARREKIIVNKYGVKFTPLEVKSIVNKIKAINRKIDKRYRWFVAGGVSEKRARELAGNLLKEDINAFTTKQSVGWTLKGMRTGYTMRALTEKNSVMITNFMNVIADRFGLNDEDFERIDDKLRSMSVVEFQVWYEKYEGLIDETFAQSPKIGVYVTDQEYIDELSERLEEALGVKL